MHKYATSTRNAQSVIFKALAVYGVTYLGVGYPTPTTQS